MPKPALAAAALACSLATAALTACGPTTGAQTPQPGSPLADRYPVGVRTETVIDSARSTPARGKEPAHAGRTLTTTFYYPAAYGPISGNDTSGAPARAGAFPLIVFAHGYNTNPAGYEIFLHTLAAAGYVVAAPTFPIEGAISGAAPAQRSYTEMANQMFDMSAVITAVTQRSGQPGNWLHGAVNAANVGVVGHSDGAMTVAGMQLSNAYYDSRPKVAVVLAGAGLPIPGASYGMRRTVPVLIEQASKDPYNPVAAGRYLYDSAHGPKRYLALTGTYHMWPLVGGDYIADLTRRVVVAELDDTLKQDPTAADRLWAASHVSGYTGLLFSY